MNTKTNMDTNMPESISDKIQRLLDEAGPAKTYRLMMCREEVEKMHQFVCNNDVDRLWVYHTPGALMGTIEIADVDKCKPFAPENQKPTDITAWDRI